MFCGAGVLIVHSKVEQRAGVIFEIDAYSTRIELVDCLFFP